MKFIAKEVATKKFKIFESITEFNIEDFGKYELYSVRNINKQQYVNAVKQQKIEELKQQLKSLGVDINAPAPAVAEKEVQDDLNFNSQISLEEDIPYDTGVVLPSAMVERVNMSQKLSRVTNRATGKKFTMEDLQNVFYKFKENIEREIEEIQFCSFDEDGFKLTMTDLRPDIMKQLPNGIPLIQILA
jgi:hypothetical protein